MEGGGGGEFEGTFRKQLKNVIWKIILHIM